MNSPKIACLLSTSVMFAATFPALAQQSGEQEFRDRQPQRELEQQRYYQPEPGDSARGHVNKVRYRGSPYGYYSPGFYYGPPTYYQTPYAAHAPAFYYGDPAYYAAPSSYPSYVYRALPNTAAVPPPPRAAIRAPAITPAARRFTLSSDALFDFDQAVLKPEGIRQLDKLAADLKGADYNALKFNIIKVTGHTDRLGSDSYNMQLSTRRVEAVKQYLVNLGIPSARIVATGEGATNPVTAPGECRDDKASQELIACLQPDRRVDIEFLVAENRSSTRNFPAQPPSVRAPAAFGPQTY